MYVFILVTLFSLIFSYVEHSGSNVTHITLSEIIFPPPFIIFKSEPWASILIYSITKLSGNNSKKLASVKTGTLIFFFILRKFCLGSNRLEL